MRERMGWRLWQEWLAYMTLEPFGFPFERLRLAYALANLGNFAGGKAAGKNKREAFRTDEFWLRFDEEPKARRQTQRLSVKQTDDFVSGLFAAFGARRTETNAGGGR